MASVFISHSTADKQAALRLRELLTKNDFRSLFLDSERDDGIAAGKDWERELYVKLRACRALIALSSKNYVASQWCFAEVAQARALGKRIFPLKLDGAPLHPLLLDTQAIDWSGSENQDGVARLMRGLHDAGIVRGQWHPERSPYPGLFCFEEDDAAVFFGREQLIEDVLSRLATLVRQGEPRWLTLCGPSGCGKSSVLRAGLLPRLRNDKTSWIVVGAFRRGIRAIESLALAFAKEFERLRSPRPAADILRELEGDPGAAFADLARELRFAAGRAEALVLIVPDQFEEFLPTTQHSDSTETPERAREGAFLRELRRLAEAAHGEYCVLTTIRSDLLGAFADTPALQGMRTEQLVVPPLDPDQLPRVIEEPAPVAGVAFSPELTAELIRDMETADALPLLAFALRELYERFRTNGEIRLEDYRTAIGGLPQAVALRAAEVFAECERRFGSGGKFTTAQAAAIKAAFLSLVRLTDDGAPARRRQPRSELPASALPVLAAFAEARLLTSGMEEGPNANDGSGESYFEVAHEAVFRSWKVYRDWITDYGALLAWRKRTESALGVWRASRASSDLLRSERLSEASAWLHESPELLTADEQAFIRAGRASRRNSRFVAASAVLLAFALLAMVSVYLRNLQTEAEKARAVAQKSAKEARTVALLAVERGHKDPNVRAALLREIPAPGPLQWWQAALDAMQRSTSVAAIRPHHGPIVQLAFTRDGSKLVSLGEDHSLVVSDVASGRSNIVSTGVKATLFALSPSERLLLATDQEVYVGTLDTREFTRKAGTGKPVALSFPDDEHALVAWANEHPPSQARFLELINALGSEAPVRVDAPGISAAAFGDGGADIFWGTFDNQIWMNGKAQPLLREENDEGWVTRVVPCRGTLNTRLLAVHNNGMGAAELLRVLDLKDGARSRTRRFGATVDDAVAAISPDCSLVASTTSEVAEIADYWTERMSVRLEGNSALITALAFAQDGNRVASGALDGTVRVWSTALPDQPAHVRLCAEWCNVLAVSADGIRVLLEESGALKLFDVATGTSSRIPVANWPRNAAFSRSGSTLVVAESDAVVAHPTKNPEVSIRRIDVNGVRAVALSDEIMAYGTAAGGVWGARLDGSPPARLALGQASVSALAFSPGGDRVIAGFEDGNVKSVSIDGKESVPLRSHTETVRLIAVGGDGAIATAGGMSVHVLSAGGRQVVLPDNIGNVRGLAFNASSTRVVTSAGDNRVRIWNADGNGSPVTLPAAQPLLPKGSDVVFSADGKRVLSFGAYEARIWSLDARSTLWRQGAPCLAPQMRHSLLGGSMEEARKATEVCQRTLQACRASFAACESAVRENYDTKDAGAEGS